MIITLSTLLSFGDYFSSYLAAMIGGEILILPIIINIKLGELNFFFAMLAAVCGTLTRDWFVFLLFRKYGQKIISTRPKLANRLEEAKIVFSQKATLPLCSYRLMFGLVNFIVITLAITGTSIRRFAFISLISNVFFIIVMGSCGYYFTEILSTQINWIHAHKSFGFGIIVLVVLLFYFIKNKKGAII